MGVSFLCTQGAPHHFSLSISLSLSVSLPLSLSLSHPTRDLRGACVFLPCSTSTRKWNMEETRKETPTSRLHRKRDETVEAEYYTLEKEAMSQARRGDDFWDTKRRRKSTTLDSSTVCLSLSLSLSLSCSPLLYSLSHTHSLTHRVQEQQNTGFVHRIATRFSRWLFRR